MADAQIVVLAKRVVTELNAATWETGGWTATRTYKPKAELESTGSVKVLVAMSQIRPAPDNRSEWKYEYDVDIGVLYRAAASISDPTTTFDTYLRLIEQIADYYRFTRPQTTNADCVLSDVGFGGPGGQPYFPEHIEKFNQFTGVVRLTFKQWRT